MARATIKYGNVYLLARRSSSSRSCLVSTILYGLLRGKLMPSRQQYNQRGRQGQLIRYRIYGEKYLAYDAIRVCATAALHASGYRVVRGGSEHYRTIEALEFSIDPQKKLIPALDKLRKK